MPMLEHGSSPMQRSFCSLTELSLLPRDPASEGVRLALVQATDSSYGAVAIHPALAGIRCVVFIGGRSPFPEATTPGDVVCGRPRSD